MDLPCAGGCGAAPCSAPGRRWFAGALSPLHITTQKHQGDPSANPGDGDWCRDFRGVPGEQRMPIPWFLLQPLLETWSRMAKEPGSSRVGVTSPSTSCCPLASISIFHPAPFPSTPQCAPRDVPAGPGTSMPVMFSRRLPAPGLGFHPHQHRVLAAQLVFLSSVPLLGAREVALGRSLASPVCYYRIKLPFKAEPALSGLHTIREHRLFPEAPILFLCSLGATTLPALGTERGAWVGGSEKVLGGFSSHPAGTESREGSP